MLPVEVICILTANLPSAVKIMIRTPEQLKSSYITVFAYHLHSEGVGFHSWLRHRLS